MRAAILLAFCAVATFGQAQDWALINPAYKYNYSNDGTDTISNQIFVTDFDILGVDSFRYELNKIGVVCGDCSQDLTSGCSTGLLTDVVHANSPQGPGSVIRRQGSSWLIERSSDTLLILPQEPLGASWTGPGNITATIFDAMDPMLFGETDSLKHIAFSTGDTIVIAKDHGIHTIASGYSGDDALVLVGVSGSITVGVQYPAVLDLFNYQVGDVLQYHDEAQFQSSFCVHYVDGTSKYRVLDRVDEPGVTTYSMQRIFSWNETSYYPLNWTPCGTQDANGTELLTLVIDHEAFTEANFFGSGLRGAIHPSALDLMTPDPEYEPFLRTLMISGLDPLQRVVLEPYVHDPAGFNATLFCPSDQDSLDLLPSFDGAFSFTYCEGVGLMYQNYFSFESGNSRLLVGYEINGVQFGTITPDGVLLEVAMIAEDPLLRILPNPTSDHLTLLVQAPVVGNWRILGANGQMHITGTMQHDARQEIDVSSIPEGIYLLDLTTSLGRVSQRFIIAR